MSYLNVQGVDADQNEHFRGVRNEEFGWCRCCDASKQNRNVRGAGECGGANHERLQTKLQHRWKKSRDYDGDDTLKDAKGQNVVQIIGFDLAKKV